MERPQLLGTNVERCCECRGHVVQVWAEFACTCCPRVKRRHQQEAGKVRGRVRRLLQTSQSMMATIRTIGEGRSPRTLTAVCIYLASREAGPRVVSQREIAESLGIAEYTIREFVATVSHEFGLPPLRGGGP